MDLHILEGREAVARLACDDFCRRWETLWTQCDWATAFQSLAFARAWYDSYAAAMEPVLVLGYAEEDAKLSGLLALARDLRTGALVNVGAHQAEYHAWIARDEGSDRFIITALAQLRRRYPSNRLLFRYVPPGTPLDWCKARGPIHGLCALRPVPRPVIRLEGAGVIDGKLAKKGNRSRLNRLREAGGGELDARIVVSEAELTVAMDEIVREYDERQSAAHGAVPFGSDPFKKAFYLELFRAGLLHVFVLRAGPTLAAAVLSVKSRTMLSVGVFAHSARLEQHSPGKFGMLLLAREAAREGWHCIDLTPGGAWKERFANDRDIVVELTVRFSRAAAMRSAAGERALRVAKRGLALLGLTPHKLRAVLGKASG